MNRATDLEDLLQNSGGEIAPKGSETRQRLNQLMETAKATCQRLEAKVVNGAKATDQAIRTHPYQSIGVAFGIGMFLGYLWTRKK